MLSGCGPACRAIGKGIFPPLGRVGGALWNACGLPVTQYSTGYATMVTNLRPGQPTLHEHSIGARDLGKTSKIGRQKKQERGLEINLPTKHTTPLVSRAGSRSHDVFHHHHHHHDFFVENARGLKRSLVGGDWLLSASLISGALPRLASSMAISCVIPAVGRVWPFFAYLA